MAQYIDPVLLGLVPPMDIGRAIVSTSLPGLRGITNFPLKLRLRGGLFGTVRIEEFGRLIRSHDGVDLLANVPERDVFAAQAGKIIRVTDHGIDIEHTAGFRYLTCYREIEEPVLIRWKRDADDNLVFDENIFAADMEGETVAQGERIARVKDFKSGPDHLHFEVRYPFGRDGQSRSDTLAVDPTWALYAWEKKLQETFTIESARIISLREMVRQGHLRFLVVNIEESERNFYFHLNDMGYAGKSLVETLRTAFFAGYPVTLTWGESLFFNQIEYGPERDDKIAMLTGVQVFVATPAKKKGITKRAS